MSEITILVTSAGRRVGLIECFRDACQALGVGVRILAADLNPDLSAACAKADGAFALPPVVDSDYPHAIERLCAAQGVGLLVPTIDPELLPISLSAPNLAAQNVHVNVSSPEVIRTARDKLRTAEVLSRAGIRVPRSWTFDRGRHDGLAYPLVAKPRGGSSSAGLRFIDHEAQLESLEDRDDYLLQERLSGPEYTVNLFVGADGLLKSAVPHRRIETRQGEVSKGRTERNPAFSAIARKIVEALPGARGAMCFQFIVDPEGPAVFEINARFGGGYPLAHHAGAPFARWLVEEALGRPSTASDTWRDGVLMLRYDAEIFA